MATQLQHHQWRNVRQLHQQQRARDRRGLYNVIASNSVSVATSSQTYVKVYPAPTATFTNFVTFTNRVEYLVNGINGYSYTVQGTTDFITWTNLQSGVADFVFTNYFSTNNSLLFFRDFLLAYENTFVHFFGCIRHGSKHSRPREVRS